MSSSSLEEALYLLEKLKSRCQLFTTIYHLLTLKGGFGFLQNKTPDKEVENMTGQWWNVMRCFRLFAHSHTISGEGEPKRETEKSQILSKVI